MSTIPKIVLSNPFRILGVYANSPKRDIVANKSKVNAFLKVGKLVEFPLDLNALLPSLERTLDLFDVAESHLSIDKEKITYAQFWFLMMTHLDEVAFNHLCAGKLNEAMEIWSKQESLSSLQNKMVCYLIENKLWLAMNTAEMLYEEYGDTYIDKVDGNSTLQMTGVELFHNFVDTLGKEIGFLKLLEFELGSKTKEYVRVKAVEPLVKTILSEVESAKKIDHNDSEDRKAEAQRLMDVTEEPLRQLKNVLSPSDPQYVVIADKLGLEILQCGIDYYNNTSDEMAAYDAMCIQKYALSIVEGTIAVGRCKENVEILQNIIDKLPPKEIASEYNLLMRIIAEFVNPPKKERVTEGAKRFIDIQPWPNSRFTDSIMGPSLPDNTSEIKTFFMKIQPIIIAMKEKVGRNESHYVEISTLVGRIVVKKSVDLLNAVQQKLIDWHNTVKTQLAPNPNHAFSLQLSFRSIVSKVWNFMLLIELMDLTEEFRNNQLKPNKSALLSIATNAKIHLSKTAEDVTFFYSEKECFDTCKTKTSYEKYLNRFPEGKYYKEAKEKIMELDYYECKKYADYKHFLKNYPEGYYSRNAEEILKNIEAQIEKELAYANSVQQCCAILKKYKADPGGKIDTKAYLLCNSKEELQLYADTFTSRREDARKRIEEKRNTNNIIIVILVAVFIIMMIIIANANE